MLRLPVGFSATVVAVIKVLVAVSAGVKYLRTITPLPPAAPAVDAPFV
jgi:hypothetical protein